MVVVVVVVVVVVLLLLLLLNLLLYYYYHQVSSIFSFVLEPIKALRCFAFRKCWKNKHECPALSISSFVRTSCCITSNSSFFSCFWLYIRSFLVQKNLYDRIIDTRTNNCESKQFYKVRKHQFPVLVVVQATD